MFCFSPRSNKLGYIGLEAGNWLEFVISTQPPEDQLPPTTPAGLTPVKEVARGNGVGGSGAGGGGGKKGPPEEDEEEDPSGARVMVQVRGEKGTLSRHDACA